MSTRKMLTNYNMDPLHGTPATNDNELYGHVLGHSPNLGVSSICGSDSYDSYRAKESLKLSQGIAHTGGPMNGMELVARVGKR